MSGGLASVLGLSRDYNRTGTALMGLRPSAPFGNGESLIGSRKSLGEFLMATNDLGERRWGDANASLREQLRVPPGVTALSSSDGNAFFEKVLVAPFAFNRFVLYDTRRLHVSSCKNVLTNMRPDSHSSRAIDAYSVTPSDTAIVPAAPIEAHLHLSKRADEQLESNLPSNLSPHLSPNLSLARECGSRISHLQPIIYRSSESKASSRRAPHASA